MIDVKDCFKTVLTIAGTVIGAGFISGREIVTFFYGYNAVLSSAVFSVLFFIATIILFFDTDYVNSKYFAAAKPLIYIGDLVLCAGMLSALNEIYNSVFPFMNETFILPVITLIVSNVIVSGGIEGLKSANTFLTPVIIVIAVFSVVYIGFDDVTVFSAVSPVNLCSYVGLNVFTSCLVFAEIGKKTQKKTKFLAAFIVSVLLGALIFMILSAFSSADKSILDADMPLLSYMKGNGAFSVVFFVALVFGIVTTLISCHCPLYALVKTEKLNFLTQACLSILIFMISRLGFYGIVSSVYPVMGAIGFIYIFITCVLKAIFPPKQRKNTLSPRERKV